MENPYQRLEKIGAGSFSTVYKGIHRETKQLVAIKILNLDTAEDEVADIRTEISLLTQLKLADIQNVTRYYGSHLYGSKLWIIMDYCHGGSIRTLMEAGRIEERYIAIIMREVLLALAYVHKCGIIHRDIKAANILMANDGRIQLCDFGVATQLAANHLKRNTFVGTPYWMAPEVITEGSMYNFKADIWSLGITVYEIATGRPPHADQEQMRALFLIPRCQPARLEGPNFTPHMKEFVGLCLQLSPEQRPTADELAKSRFIRNTSKTPTSVLRDLIIRYAKWQEAGGVRQSTMISNRRGSTASTDDIVQDIDNENDIIAWDFDTTLSDTINMSHPEEHNAPPFAPVNDLSWGYSDTLPSTIPAPPPSAVPLQGALEHPLEQLFNDDTVRSATAVAGLRPRKDTMPSRPVSPLPPLPVTTIQPSNPESDYRQGPNLGMGSYDLRLPEIPSSGPIQIEIPATEETLRKDTSAVRSRSATVTRTARSDSTGSAGFPARIARYNAQEPMPQPHSPPTSSRAASPKPQQPLPPSLSLQGPTTINLPKVQSIPLSPPKTVTILPLVPPGSPPKGHISSKSVPNATTLSNAGSLGASFSQEPGLNKPRPPELKPSRPPHLTLNLPQAQILPVELSPRPFSPSRARSATTTEASFGVNSPAPTITAIPPSPAAAANGDSTWSTLGPLNLSVLTEEPQPGNGAGKLLSAELERILTDFAGILDVVGKGLTTLGTQSGPVEVGKFLQG